MPIVEDLFGGVWKANLEKSQPDGNHCFRQATMRLEPNEDGYKLTAEGIGADGKPCVENPTLIHFDGAEHPCPGVPGAFARALRPDPNTIQVEAKKDGRVIGKATYSVAPDGKSLTAKTSGTDVQGRAFETVVIFDRE